MSDLRKDQTCCLHSCLRSHHSRPDPAQTPIDAQGWAGYHSSLNKAVSSGNPTARTRIKVQRKAPRHSGTAKPRNIWVHRWEISKSSSEAWPLPASQPSHLLDGTELKSASHTHTELKETLWPWGKLNSYRNLIKKNCQTTSSHVRLHKGTGRMRSTKKLL